MTEETHTYVLLLSSPRHSRKQSNMDPAEYPLGRPSPRRELQLQGPRPTPLKVRKDSHKIKKPPIAPPQGAQQQQQQQAQYQLQQRQPLIIYTVSPKVIHTDPCDFMSLVQRLTGPTNSTSTSTTTTTTSSSGAMSPAARFATIEKTRTLNTNNHIPSNQEEAFNSRATTTTAAASPTFESLMEGQPTTTHHHQTCFPGILSPHPSSLPAISPNFFSSLPDPNSFNFLHDLSPMNRNFIEGSFIPSPSTLFSSSPSHLISPTLSFDLFNQFSDF